MNTSERTTVANDARCYEQVYNSLSDNDKRMTKVIIELAITLFRNVQQVSQNEQEHQSVRG